MSDKNTALAEFFNSSSKCPWENVLRGPALSIPQEYRSIPLNYELHIEYLNTRPQDDDKNELPTKNHAVLQIPFKRHRIVKIPNEEPTFVYGARFSMDISEDDAALDVININKDRLEEPYINMEMHEDFFPGTLYLKLLAYKGISAASYKTSIFVNFDFATLGEFVDFLANKKLHQMCFLSHGIAWKGCRDFITQTFVQLRLNNKIAGVDSGGKSLRDNITKVHHRNGNYEKLVERGQFLSYERIITDEIKDVYEPELVEP